MYRPVSRTRDPGPGPAGETGAPALVLRGLTAGRPLYVYIWKYSICWLKIELMISLFNTRRQLFGGITVSLPFKCSQSMAFPSI